MSFVSKTTALTKGQYPQTLSPTQVVTVVPKYGYSNGPIRIRLSHSEVEIVRRLQRQSLAPTPTTQNATDRVIYKFEKSASASPTIELGKRAMEAVGVLLPSHNPSSSKRIFIIIGRTQAYLMNSVLAVGCTPNTSGIGNAFIMGATICDRQVIVIDLTGYLFLRSRFTNLTPEMETWPEPSIASTPYLIADRNISGLGHEWVHVARSQLANDYVPENEPAWMREGLSEIVSGMARVRASEGRMTYLDFHVIRLRKFAHWPNDCKQSLTAYRINSEQLGGCEYLRGAVAVELLIANYGGLDNISRLYKDMRSTGNFFTSFKRIYKMSVSNFEIRANRYAGYITQAATYRR